MKSLGRLCFSDPCGRSSGRIGMTLFLPSRRVQISFCLFNFVIILGTIGPRFESILTCRIKIFRLFNTFPAFLFVGRILMVGLTTHPIHNMGHTGSCVLPQGFTHSRPTRLCPSDLMRGISRILIPKLHTMAKGSQMVGGRSFLWPLEPVRSSFMYRLRLLFPKSNKEARSRFPKATSLR